MGRRIFFELTRDIDVKGKEILELGCGCGELLRLAAETGAKRVIGVDISSEALTCAGAMLKDFNAILIHEDMFALKTHGVADIVWSSGLLEHFTPGRMIDVMKLHRDLAREGVAVVVPASPGVNNFRMSMPKMKRIFGFQRPLSKGRLVALGPGAGLTIRAARRFMPEYDWGRYYCLLPSAIQTLMQWAENRFGGLAIAWYDVK